MVTHKVSQHFCGQRVSLEPWFYFLLLLRMSDLDFQISAASELIASGHHVCPPQPNPASLYLKSAFVRAIWTPKQTSHFNSLLQQQHIWGEKKPKQKHNISHNYNRSSISVVIDSCILALVGRFSLGKSEIQQISVRIWSPTEHWNSFNMREVEAASGAAAGSF